MLVPSNLISICWVYLYVCLGRIRTLFDACWKELLCLGWTWMIKIWLLYLLFLRLIKYYQVLKIHRNCQSRCIHKLVCRQVLNKFVMLLFTTFQSNTKQIKQYKHTSCLLVAATCFPNIIPSFRSYLQGMEGLSNYSTTNLWKALKSFTCIFQV